MTEQLPTMTVVTPSFNQSRYIEATLLSIHSQDYPHLEHIVMDGGSTDGTLDILARYRDRLARLESARDEGQYDAINRGLRSSRGEIMAWLNSDDVYLPGTLRLVGEIFGQFPQVEWLTTSKPAAVDEDGILIKVLNVYGFTKRGFSRGDNLPGCGWPATCFIQQESTFWRRSLWERCGGFIDSSYRYAGDFELWSRFFGQAELVSVDVPLGCFRKHDTQKTSAIGSYLDEAKKIFARMGGKSPISAHNRLRLWIRRALPARLRETAFKLRLMEPAPSVTYDWAGKRWVMSRS